MDQALREHLRVIISVAIALEPRAVKKAFADRFSGREQEAQKQLSQAAADAVLTSFEVRMKPSEAAQPSLHARLMAGRERPPEEQSD